MTPDKAAQIRHAYFIQKKKQIEIAAQYGIKQNSVSRIISGMVWADA